MRRFLIATLLKFVLLGLVSSASGQAYAVRVVTKQCTAYECRYVNVYGTATCIDKTNEAEYLFLTAGHVIRDAERIQVGVDGEWRNARSGGWECDEQKDVGFIRLAYDGEIKTLDVATEVPEFGSPVAFAGYRDGRVDRQKTTLKDHQFVNSIMLTHQAAHGQSGGPVVFNGLVIGVISGFPRSGGTVCTDCMTIRRFAAQRRIRLRVRQDASGVQPTPLPQPRVSGHDARPAVGAGCECDGIKAENEKLKQQLSALENQRREVQFKTFTGQKGRANILVKRNGGTFVESLSSDGSVADSAEYAAGEPIRFDVIQVPRKE